MRRKLDSIQMLRGLAASSVVIYHCAHRVNLNWPSLSTQSSLENVGAAGVDLFFVISGFIMAYTTAERSGLPDSLAFLGNRIRRIYPLYWIWTTVLVALWAGKLALVGHKYAFTYVLASYLLIPVGNGTVFEPILFQGWTLTYEMLFYLAFALTIACGLKSSWRLPALVATFLFLAALGCALPPASGIRSVLTNPVLAEFLLGVLAADLAQRLSKARLRHLPATLAISGVVLLLASALCQRNHELRWLVWGGPNFLIVLGAALQSARLYPGILVFLGDASYSIYLSHSLVASFLGKLLNAAS
ncbi:MAG TPA: acyltransferase, partial [Terracidiphilus sp.]